MDSSFFRLVIAISGALLVIGLVLWDWLEKRTLDKTEKVLKEQRKEEFEKFEESLSEPEVVKQDGDEPLDLPSFSASKEDEVDEVEESESEEARSSRPPFIQLLVVGQTKTSIDGETLFPLFESLGLKLGDMDIYHKQVDEAHGASFSVANCVEPGTFPEDIAAPFTTPGIALFMEPVEDDNDNLALLAEMYAAAESVAEQFGAVMLDQEKKVIDEESFNRIQQQLITK